MRDEFGQYLLEKFGVELDVFLPALKLSPNAQGYILGAVTEFVLRDQLGEAGLQPKRIREKWDGPKHPHHRGDFYIRHDESWFVLESKGVKSNSEKWHGLFNREKLIRFLLKWDAITLFSSRDEVEDYIDRELPRFNDEFAENLYSNSEVARYSPGPRTTPKSVRMEALRLLGPLEIERQIAERVAYLRTKINVVETHLVSGAGSSVGERTQATPRVDEFDVLSLDLFLRSGKHEFVFVSPLDLEPSRQDADHLQQNYIVDILISGRRSEPAPPAPWSTDLAKVIESLGEGIDPKDMQIDDRSLEEIAEEVDQEAGAS